MPDLQEMPLFSTGKMVLEWDSLGLRHLGHLHGFGGTTPPKGLPGDWNDGECLGKELECGGALRSHNSTHSIIPDVQLAGKPFPAPFLEDRDQFHCHKGFLLCLAAFSPHIPRVLCLVAVPLLISLDKEKSGKAEEQQHRSFCLLKKLA